MASTEPDVRIFQNDEGDTRRVTSESAAVSARFDGYTEIDGKKAAAAAKTTGAGGAPANNAG